VGLHSGVNAATNSSARHTRKSRSAEPRSADRKKSGESRNTRPNAPARKAAKGAYRHLRAHRPECAGHLHRRSTPRPAPCLVDLDPYTFTDDLAEEIAGENENGQHTAEEVLLSAIDGRAQTETFLANDRQSP
jgi:hypothetical protein